MWLGIGIGLGIAAILFIVGAVWAVGKLLKLFENEGDE